MPYRIWILCRSSPILVGSTISEATMASSKGASGSPMHASGSPMRRAMKIRRLDASGSPMPLQSAMHIQGVSQKGHQQVLKQLGQPTSFRQMTDMGQAQFVQVKRLIKLPQEGGKEFEWAVCDPNSLVARCVEQSPGLQALFLATLQSHPCSQERP